MSFCNRRVLEKSSTRSAEIWAASLRSSESLSREASSNENASEPVACSLRSAWKFVGVGSGVAGCPSFLEGRLGRVDIVAQNRRLGRRGEDVSADVGACGSDNDRVGCAARVYAGSGSTTSQAVLDQPGLLA